MKKHVLLLPLLALTIPAVAQHTEIIGRAGLGLFRFGGKSAESTSFVNYYSRGENGYTNSPYGSRLGTGVALGGRVQHVGTREGLLTLDLGYEWLRSRTSITELYYSPAMTSSYMGSYRADGSTSLYTQNLTAFLGLGHRFKAGSVAVDAFVGPELAYVFGTREKGSGTYNGNLTWATDQHYRSANRTDLRLRADATVWCHRLGLNASYSHGFVNYQEGLVGGSPKVYARVLRLGIAYRLR